MTSSVTALLAHGRWMPADERSAVTEVLSAAHSRGTLLVTTCHRAELYGAEGVIGPLATRVPGARVISGSEAARHLIQLATGRDSTAVGEDQVLHQLRFAARRARQNGGMPAELNRLLDLALHAGRRARSWLPASRPTLADIAIDRAVGASRVEGAVLVVGAGTMGATAVRALLRRGAAVTVASRTTENARALAGRFGISHASFIPSAEQLTELAGVVIALAGKWPLPTTAARALGKSDAWVVDLSSPPAIAPDLAQALGSRLTSIDDLLDPVESGLTARVLNRLDALIDETLAEYERWLADDRQRATAHALALRARDAQAIELERLWQRAPTLDATQRVEVERAVEHLTRRLLRDPLEQLRDDNDGHHARAARELFRL